MEPIPRCNLCKGLVMLSVCEYPCASGKAWVYKTCAHCSAEVKLEVNWSDANYETLIKEPLKREAEEE